MTLEDLPPTVSVEEAGELLGISRRSAYRAAANGELPTLRLGRRLLVPTARLLEMLGVADASGRASVRVVPHRIGS
jgi:excisionase family DNA binding protein